MSYDISDWGTHSFEFKPNAASDGTARTAVAIHEGPLGPTAVIPDAHLLFTAHFERAGVDLVLRGDHGQVVVVHDYFASNHPPQLLSPDGAALSPEVVAALAGPLAPGEYAQASPTPSGAQPVGRIVKVVGDATIIRNGVAVTLHVGDAILKGDVLHTGGGSLGVTFDDGSTLNLTAHARLVVNEFVYDAHGSNNSEVLNLVQGSLTFISGHVAHQGHMKITTPVATLGIRGTVGGVTEANDGTVSFFVAESATGAVLTDNQGHLLGQVLQDGPMLLVRPVGPLNVLAQEVQKTPAELAKELAVIQQIVSLQSVGQQIIQQDLQPNNNPNPHSTGHPHTQIEIQFPSHLTADSGGTNGGSSSTADHVAATVHTTTTDNTGTIVTDTTEVVHVTPPADTTPPNAPTISVINDLTDHAISDGGIINDATPTIHVSLSGTGAVAGDTVELFNGATGVGNPVTLTAANVSAGYVEFNTPTLSDGNYHLNASITDVAGNTSVASSEFDFTVDAHAPNVPLVTLSGLDIDGHAPEYGTVTATASGVGGNSVYQWYVLNPSASRWTPVSSDASYTVGEFDVGKQIRVMSSYSDASGSHSIMTYLGAASDSDNDSDVSNWNGDIAGMGALKIEQSMALELVVTSALDVIFPTNSYGTLILDDAAHYSGTISNFVGSSSTQSDAIDLKGVSFDSITGHSYADGVLTIDAAIGEQNHEYQLKFSNFSGSFNITSDGHGGTLITDPPTPITAAKTALTVGTDHLTLDNGTRQVTATDHTLNNGDTITGGSGHDTLTVDVGNGDHTFTFGDGSHNDIGLTNFETLKLTDASATADHAVTITFDSQFHNNGTLTVDGSGLHHLGASHLTLDAHLATSDAFVFIGSASADTIIGGAKADTIIGGGGGDTLTGNGGHDTFVFKSVSDSTPGSSGGHAHYDTVTDFTHNVDHIDVAAIAGLNDHHQAVDIASLSAAPTTIAPHTIDIVTSGDHTVVYANASGTAESIRNADMEIHLSHATNVTATDFILHH